MRQSEVLHEIVEFIPEKLSDGVLYVSHKYKTAVHRCCCGCGEEVVTPLNPTDWSIDINNRGVTLDPSIGNWSFACQSHYWIRGSKVEWSGRMTQRQIEAGRAYDRHLKVAYFEEVNRRKVLDAPAEPSYLYTIWAKFKQWFKV